MASELIVCTFAGATTADQASETVREALRLHDERQPRNVAVLRKDTDGAISFWETEARSNLRFTEELGSVVGWVLGAIGTLLGAPLGPAYGELSGNVAGTEISSARDVGFPDDVLRHLGERLSAGESALIALVRPEAVAQMMLVLTELGGRPVQSSLPPELVAELRGSH